MDVSASRIPQSGQIKVLPSSRESAGGLLKVAPHLGQIPKYLVFSFIKKPPCYHVALELSGQYQIQKSNTLGRKR